MFLPGVNNELRTPIIRLYCGVIITSVIVVVASLTIITIIITVFPTIITNSSIPVVYVV